MNRNERTELFMSLYLEKVKETPDIIRYACYLRAEADMVLKTGSRQYEKYETFKASMSRREKIKRLNKVKLTNS
ncbi:hypothetical protein [Flavobacterium sp.]|jgi:hypothetical protein|uniref:hypothetical protein n=1 Tax=Flavobacterium sp. TaxID=239 RepID=UPI0037C03B6C